jgi:hypothetical protein
MRRAIVLGAVLLAACGSDSSSPGDSNAPGFPGVGVSLAPLSVASTTAKVVLNVTRPVHTRVWDEDGAMSCTSNADCTEAVDTTCMLDSGDPDYGYCVWTQIARTVLAVKNQSGADLNVPVKVPCDGRDYSIDIFGATSGGGQFSIQAPDMRVSNEFTVDMNCAISPAVSWTARSAPTWAFPAIYVGLGPPHHEFTATLQGGVAYPWAFDNWILTQATATSPLRKTASTATFAAPTTNVTALSFTSRLHLQRNLLVAGETATSWVLEDAQSAPVIQSVDVSLP